MTRPQPSRQRTPVPATSRPRNGRVDTPGHARLLVVDDQSGTAALLRSCLDERFDIVAVDSCAKAQKFLRHAAPDLVVLEARLPDGSGLILLETIRSAQPDTAVIVLNR